MNINTIKDSVPIYSINNKCHKNGLHSKNIENKYLYQLILFILCYPSEY